MEETPITLLLLSTILLILFPTTTTSTEPLLSAAAQTLTDSGFLSMGLTLRLASSTLRLPSPNTATIFVPSDAAFLRSGSLPLSLLQYHILPTRLPLQHLITLPPSTLLPTLLHGSSLTVTAASLSPPQLSINNVTVSNAAVFDDGSLLMLAVDDFFNSSSLLLVPESVVPPPNTFEPLAAVSGVLKSNGCSIMSTFLEAQLTELKDGTKLTIFAPLDEAVAENARNISDYSAIFRKHVVPRLIPWRDLIRLGDQTLLPTFSDGFMIRVTVSPRVRFLNGVPVKFPDMYCGDLVVVHGIDGLLDNSTV